MQTNIQILATLLKAPNLDTWSRHDKIRINNLPPLNSRVKGDPIHLFIFEPYQELIHYVKADSPHYKELLTKKAILDFMGIRVLKLDINPIPLD